MIHFDFEVAAMTARLEGSEEILGAFRRHFSAFSAGTVHAAPAVRFSWDGLACRVRREGAAERAVAVRAPEFRIPATLALLAGELAALRPDLTILHANAVDGPHGAVVLAGESGAGKTTLAMELAGADGWRYVAEDWVLLDADGARILPFPRALNVRDGAGGETVVEHPGPRGATASLDRATVAILNVSANDPPCGVAGETWWMTSATDALRARIVGAGGDVEDDGPLVRASFVASLPGVARGELLAACEPDGALVVQTSRGVARRRSSRPTQRPPAPELRAIESSYALQVLMPQVIRPVGNSQGGTALLMRLARAFSQARFVAVVPGGTPAQTAHALREAAGA